MRKVLAILGAAAVPVLLLSGCNGSNGPAGTSSLPNSSIAHVKMRPHDTSTNDLHAGGATFPAYAYNLGSEPTGLYTANQALPGTGSIFAGMTFASGAHIYYCLTGSGTGVGIFTSGSKGQSDGSTATTTAACAPLGATPTGFGSRTDPPDFAGSDVALASTDYTAYKTHREPSSGTNWGEPIELPVIGGPIVFAYRPVSGFPNPSIPAHAIRFSQWTYCAIANGTISNWNDTAITRDNGGVSVTGGVSQPITFVFRSDGSGTSYNFTYHLSTVCQGAWPAPYNAKPYEYSGHSAAWTYGFSKNWPGPGSASVPNAHFIGESGNPGVLAEIQVTPYSTGYVEGAWAASGSPAVAQAILGTSKNKTTGFADPTNSNTTKNSMKVVSSADITYGGGSDGVPLATSRPECILYIDPSKFTNPIANGAPNASYPIMAVSYLLFYQHQNGLHYAQKNSFISQIYGSKALAIESSMEYTPLNSGVITAGLNAKNGSGGNPACLQK